MITHQELLDGFDYNPVTGILYRMFKSGETREVGSMNRYGYLTVNFNGHYLMSHRLAWFYIHGDWPKYQIDHVNHVRDDNRLVNLREVTSQENGRNRLLNKNNSSGYAGVSWYKSRNMWLANIRKSAGKTVHLGYFREKGDAVAARKAAEVKYGYHENHGNPVV